MPKKSTIPDNPVGEAYGKPFDGEDDRYITTTNVGTHAVGATGTRKELGPGAQIPRLLDEGAIAVAPEPVEGEQPEGTAADLAAQRTDPSVNIGKGPAAPGHDTRPVSDPESGHGGAGGAEEEGGIFGKRKK